MTESVNSSLEEPPSGPEFGYCLRQRARQIRTVRIQDENHFFEAQRLFKNRYADTWIVLVVVGKYSESLERNFLFDCIYIVRTRRTANQEDAGKSAALGVIGKRMVLLEISRTDLEDQTHMLKN